MSLVRLKVAKERLRVTESKGLLQSNGIKI